MKSGMKNRLRMFRPYFYFRISSNRVFLTLQIKARSFGSRSHILLAPVGIAFRPISPQKPHTKFQLGPSAFAIHLFWHLNFHKTATQTSARHLGPRLSSVANAPAPTFSPIRCPPCDLRHAEFDSNHAECFWYDMVQFLNNIILCVRMKVLCYFR